MRFKKVLSQFILGLCFIVFLKTAFAQMDPHVADIMKLQKDSKAIIDDYFKSQKSPSVSDKGELFILVSFSMPDTLIKQYVKEAKRYGGRVVIRGMINNDFALTQQRIKEMGGMTIDPNVFENYAIKTVPAMILSSDPYPCIDPACEAQQFDVMMGAVKIRYALEAFSEEGDLKALASELLRKAS